MSHPPRTRGGMRASLRIVAALLSGLVVLVGATVAASVPGAVFAAEARADDGDAHGEDEGRDDAGRHGDEDADGEKARDADSEREDDREDELERADHDDDRDDRERDDEARARGRDDEGRDVRGRRGASSGGAHPDRGDRGDDQGPEDAPDAAPGPDAPRERSARPPVNTSNSGGPAASPRSPSDGDDEAEGSDETRSVTDEDSDEQAAGAPAGPIPPRWTPAMPLEDAPAAFSGADVPGNVRAASQGITLVAREVSDRIGDLGFDPLIPAAIGLLLLSRALRRPDPDEEETVL